MTSQVYLSYCTGLSAASVIGTDCETLYERMSEIFRCGQFTPCPAYGDCR
jgi:hypothetical protein